MDEESHDTPECFGGKYSSSTTSVLDMGVVMHQISEENVDGAHKELVALLSSECVLVDNDILRAHSSTPWSPAPPTQSPTLVVTPRSTPDVSQIMKICSRRRIPVTAYSGGTSFAGALTATRRGICIDFQKMDKILAVHENDMDVVVQPGVGWQDLNRDLEPRGLFFPPDPGAGARIGGMVRDAHYLHFSRDPY
ncbi:MAG: hypothetical protein Q9188_003845 [Gyalolechia gomerana]